jgi:hypothetical protein
VEAKKETELNLAFVLLKKDLSRLNEIVRGYLGSNADVSFRVTCANNTTLTWDSITPVHDYDNARKKQIDKLVISGTSENRKKRVSIVLKRTRNPYIVPIEITVTGEDVTEASVQNTFQSLEETCEGMAPWFGWVATVNILKVLLYCLLTLIIAAGLGVAHYGIEHVFPSGPRTAINILIGAVAGWVVPSILHYIHHQYFPKGTFAIGQGERRHQNAEVIRIGIIVAFLVSVASSVAVGLFM